MTRLAAKARTLRLLGIGNIARVALYRLGLRTGLHPAQRVRAIPALGPFFRMPEPGPVDAPPTPEWADIVHLYGAAPIALGDGPPDWLADPKTGAHIAGADLDWWRIPDFGGSDIKNVWEFSRMDWALAFAQRVRNGDAASLDRLNDWLDDWLAVNPPYRGPNWKCGQEASIRLLHLAMAVLLLGQERVASDALLDLVATHLRRIAPTLSYAAAQCNNHATSEAAALFVGGSWLSAHGRHEGARLTRIGRERLERHVADLFGEDGSFSQYSVNYHRVALDTLSMAEVWRRRLDLQPFSECWLGRARAATRWLAALVDPETGDAPNLGANDGARLLPLTSTPYRDYRPSVQLATALFSDEWAYPPGSHDAALRWLGIPMPARTASPLGSEMHDNGGLAILRRGAARAIVKYPRHRFRPSQSDALHLDLWLGAVNVLRDGGTFSYNDPDGWGEYFASVAAHNSVEFDGEDQMPRLGRFLFGDWLKTAELEAVCDDGSGTRFAAGYRDRQGRSHRREVALEEGRLTVIDTVSGFAKKAVLRWRLVPGEWTLRRGAATCDGLRLEVTSDPDPVRMEIVTGQESRHYQERTPLPVLEVEANEAVRFVTELRWDK